MRAIRVIKCVSYSSHHAQVLWIRKKTHFRCAAAGIYFSLATFCKYSFPPPWFLQHKWFVYNLTRQFILDVYEYLKKKKIFSRCLATHTSHTHTKKKHRKKHGLGKDISRVFAVMSCRKVNCVFCLKSVHSYFLILHEVIWF